MNRLQQKPSPLIWLTQPANFSAESGHSFHPRFEKRKAMSSDRR